MVSSANSLTLEARDSGRSFLFKLVRVYFSQLSYLYAYVGLCIAIMYRYVWLCRALYGYVKLCMAM